MFKRTRYQFGWLRRKPRRRGPDVWVWTYRSTMSNGGCKENSVIGIAVAVSLEDRGMEGAGRTPPFNQRSKASRRDNFRCGHRPLSSRGNSRAAHNSQPLQVVDQESH